MNESLMVYLLIVKGANNGIKNFTNLNVIVMTSNLNRKYLISVKYTAWKVSKYGVISDPYFPVFGLNTGKYRPEITPHLDTFHAVIVSSIWSSSWV